MNHTLATSPQLRPTAVDIEIVRISARIPHSYPCNREPDEKIPSEYCVGSWGLSFNCFNVLPSLLHAVPLAAVAPPCNVLSPEGAVSLAMGVAGVCDESCPRTWCGTRIVFNDGSIDSSEREYYLLIQWT
jgi:hypothetical protein